MIIVVRGISVILLFVFCLSHLFCSPFLILIIKILPSFKVLSRQHENFNFMLNLSFSYSLPRSDPCFKGSFLFFVALLLLFVLFYFSSLLFLILLLFSMVDVGWSWIRSRKTISLFYSVVAIATKIFVLSYLWTSFGVSSIRKLDIEKETLVLIHLQLLPACWI